MLLTKRGLGFAALVLLLPATGLSAELKSQTARARAEKACYDDAQKLCPDDIPDEDKIAVCMGRNRKALSPLCREAYDKGLQ